MKRRALAAVILAALLYAGFRPVGPVPPLGPLLDPANGAWAVAAATSFPAVQSRVLPGLKGEVRVLIDDRGVPHIFATDELDAYRALGYVVARDRLFQMETQTRAATGRLSEWAGPRLLEADRQARGMGLAWGAERKWKAYDRSTPAYRAIVAYGEGVNAWIDDMRPRDLPVEYRLLNARPMRWEPIHSFYFLARMSLTLGLNDASLKRSSAEAVIGKAAANALYPVNSPIQEPIQPNGLHAPRYDFGEIPLPAKPDRQAVEEARLASPVRAALFPDIRSDASDALGSNNWAVSPARSSTGHAMLAGDPHLELSLPSVWYEMHLVVPGRLDVAGVGFPGMPGVVIGFNRTTAWTFTNTGSDVNDFYIETVDDSASPSRYMVDSLWRNLDKQVETYRNQAGRVFHTDTLYYTHRGPMRKIGGKWLSMRWTAHETSSEPDNFLSLATASSVDDWLERMRGYVAPTQNGLVADRAGNIAIRSSGAYPIRPGDGRGDLILDGSRSANDWKGTLPVERYPFAKNPPQGFLASANQQPVDPLQNPAYIGSDWYSPWRALRINQLLRSSPKVTPDEMRRFQTDPGSARADAFVPLFLQASTRADSAGRGSAALREAARLLGAWDRRYVRDNREAVLFEAAMARLNRNAWDELRDSSDSALVPPPEPQLLLRLAQWPNSEWWDNRSTPGVEDRDAIVASSLEAAYDSLVREKGDPRSDGWLWSRNRYSNIHHLLRLPAFSALKVPVQGGPGLLNPSSGSGIHGASWRMVVELGPEIRAWAVYPGGQSGFPASRRYRDRLSRWAMGQLDPVLFPRSPEDLERKRVISTLTLTPR